jgi:tetratricopeptide (TPR) repeat protein
MLARLQLSVVSRAVATLSALALLAACAPGRSTPPPVELDLADAEASVRTLIEQKLAAARAEPGDAAARLALAMAYDANGFHQAALNSYEQAVELDPESAKAWYLAALARERLGDAPGAHDALRRVMELEPDYGPAHWRSADWLLDAGDLDGAEAAFREAGRVAPDDPAGWTGIAQVELRRGDPEQAASILERLIAQHPRDRWLHHLLGTAYQRAGNADGAARELALGRESRRNWRDPWRDELGPLQTGFTASIGRGEALIAARRYDEAITLLESLRAERPEDLPVLNNLSVAYLRAGRIDEALAVLEVAEGVSPDYFPTQLNLSGAYERMGDAERALHHVDRAIEINPTLGSAHQRRGIILLREKRYEEALEALETALQYEAGNTMLLLYAGVAAGELERWPSAIGYLERACAEDPRNLQAHLALIYAHVETGELDEAEAVLQRARAIQPQHPKLREAEAKIAAARGAG